MAVDSEIYLDAKEAFTFLRDEVGIDIIYRSRLQLCVTGTFQRKSDWQQVGFVEEETVHVDMLDDDFADFQLSGFDEDQQPTVTLEETLFQVIQVDSNPATPTVRLFLTKDK